MVDSLGVSNEPTFPRLTCPLKWIKYEIDKSLEGDNGLLGIQIHHFKDPINPDERVGAAPSQIKANGFNVYKYTNRDALARHIEEAAILAGR